ncbi:heteromeric transposase endonuclease subunit TnsA [Chromobacterium sp. ATCC 53434]|uniref:TnsA endonuclease N-terminal domain-containing protein n=1 Tax=Chromobacterium sp. (strain ATCC 53434 / SC 14030) TaxID=2059672 RepID=UPI000C756BFF|nr:TnsA endonuclease N-terminal domain-containing protein [Chromobacterium sp. ATCC 53434]AUH53687.1 heteromeric transposase endonuclease subunit TnsA [Chromobacterium sp. ATCC 53434]
MNHLQRYTPVRDIVYNSRSVTGMVPLLGDYESTLERDLMEILRFDPSVEYFTAQPVTIGYFDQFGKMRTYTPDGLIQFKPTASLTPQPVLYEVKYRADFRQDWRNLLRKFRAAKAYALDQGWRFEVFTEREIRTPYLDNAKFLWRYLEQSPSPDTRRQILQVLWDLDETDPEMLLFALCRDANNRARLIPTLWHLVAIGAIGCDLNAPLTMRSRLWPVEEC